tara:strand:+ start:370 stop:903 length:534 start_codon:yes stop_codon:yes gene_type:complete
MQEMQRQEALLAQGQGPMAMRGMRFQDDPSQWYRDGKFQTAGQDMVHRDGLHDLQQKGHFRRGAAAPAGAQALRYGLVAHAQDTRGDGQAGRAIRTQGQAQARRGIFRGRHQGKGQKEAEKGPGQPKTIERRRYGRVDAAGGSRYRGEEQPLPIFQDEGAHLPQSGGNRRNGGGQLR